MNNAPTQWAANESQLRVKYKLTAKIDKILAATKA
jgi:hypothetical protein